MHVPTHIMSGWCVGNLFLLNAKERFCCMAAATLADVDGLGIVAGERAYQEYHHVVGHNLLFCIVISAGLAAASARAKRALIMFLLYMLLGHLHLLLDYFGSGPLWRIYYLWPFSRWGFRYDGAWEFYSWQNICVASVFLAWMIAIALVRNGRHWNG